jgi:hypothetical protein
MGGEKGVLNLRREKRRAVTMISSWSRKSGG